jgi:integrase/recombinase XerD
MPHAAILRRTQKDDDTLIMDFMRDCETRLMTKESIRRYKSPLLMLHEFLDKKNKSFETADREDIIAFLSFLKDRQKCSVKTIGNYFSALSSFYEFLIFKDLARENLILPVRKRYLKQYKKPSYGFGNNSPRKLISIEEMETLISSILDSRDRAMLLLLAKTGIRREELVMIDVSDIDWKELSITLKPRAKRSNRLVFFDDETARILKKWLHTREMIGAKDDALFIGTWGGRINGNDVYDTVVKHATRVGLHNSKSSKDEDHFSPHCFRHWFTTYLRKAGMKKEFIQELRGDKRKEAIDIYDHIDREELRMAYLACIPQLDI